MEQLRKIYSDYIAEAARIQAAAKPADGLFGLGEDPRKDPCHMRFYEAAEQWVKDFLAAGPSGEEAFAVVRFLLEAPEAHRGESCFWFLYAAQGFARELIPRLSREDCARLRTYYDGAYPKRDRMPVQEQVYKLLRRKAK